MAHERAERTPSAVSRNFANNPLPRGTLEAGCVPGIGNAQVLKLKQNGVETFDQLFGRFFNSDRDGAKFAVYLEDIGIHDFFARECARNLAMKLGDL